MRPGAIRAGALAIVVIVSMVVGGVLAVNVGQTDSVSTTPVAASQTPPPSTTLPVSSTPVTPQPRSAAIASIENLPDLVEQVSPSVVLISTRVESGVFGGQGVGSGVVIDTQGHILTNYHVVEGADSVTVELADGTVAVGTILGTDPGNDLAVVRASLPPALLVPATFGDSDAVRVGEPVFAIGNPFSLNFSVTSGIVSAIARERPALDGRPIRNVIQTDAAVNPGNSGGPLFNARGEVLGINTSIENPTGQGVFVGIGFAVPSNTAQRFLPRLINGERIGHPQLGIAGVALNDLNATEAGVDVTEGVYVTSVASDSAAAEAGLRAPNAAVAGQAFGRGGDVITAIDGTPVGSVSALAEIIDGHDVGDTVTLTIVRAGETVQFDATLLEWQAS